jgi:hypothetical protein
MKMIGFQNERKGVVVDCSCNDQYDLNTQLFLSRSETMFCGIIRNIHFYTGRERCNDLLPTKSDFIDGFLYNHEGLSIDPTFGVGNKEE